MKKSTLKRARFDLGNSKRSNLALQNQKPVYLDHASSALKSSANPGAIHELGINEKNKLENARKTIASILSVRPQEIIFTSGATESNNLGILGLVNYWWSRSDLKNSKRSYLDHHVPHIITTNIEHASVLEVCKHLEKTKQAEVTYMPVEKNGILDPKKISQALRPETILVSVMYANNEIGTIQPIRKIAKEIRHFKKMSMNKVRKYTGQTFGTSSRSDLCIYEPCPPSPFPYFHTDATQAINYLPINIEKLGVDMMSFNGAKIYGPKGIGILFKKNNLKLESIMFGGNQEFNLRPGTENVKSAMELAQALKITEKLKSQLNATGFTEIERLNKLKNYFIKKLDFISKKLELKIILNGDQSPTFFKGQTLGIQKGLTLEKCLSLPNNINITIPKIPSDLLVLELSARKIYISEKSACKSGEQSSSHVIKALRTDNLNSLRFSLGRETNKNQIDYVIKNLKQILLKLKKWY
ncbi:MAG: cysteine desulfurase family protein [Patescibacteria group bacterium]